MLASDKFYEYFRTQLAAWGTRSQVLRGSEFWSRLNGENTYCARNDERNDHASIGLINHTGGKYKQVNLSGYDRYRTVEFRVLPMFQKAALSVSAIECLIEIVESYLDRSDLLDVSQPVSMSDMVADWGSELTPIKRTLDSLELGTFGDLDCVDPVVIPLPTVTHEISTVAKVYTDTEIVTEGPILSSVIPPPMQDLVSLDDASPGSVIALRCDALNAIRNQLGT